MYILKFRQRCAFLTSLLLQIPEVYVKKNPLLYTLYQSVTLCRLPFSLLLTETKTVRFS